MKVDNDEAGYGDSAGQHPVGTRRLVDGSGSTAYYYNDVRGRLSQQTKTITSAGTFVTQWGYDAADRVTWIKYPGGNGGQVGEQVNTTYNPQGLPQTLVGTASYVTGMEYNELGQFTRMKFGYNFRETRHIYRSDNYRLWHIESGGPSDSGLQLLQYTYDTAGNVTQIEDWTAGPPAPQVQSFTYDSLDRLLSAQATGGSGGTYVLENYGYSGISGNIGNLTSKAGVSYTYQDAAHKHAVTHLNGVQKYWYDANPAPLRSGGSVAT